MMQVRQERGRLELIRFDIRLDEFPCFLKEGIGDDDRLANTEARARELVESGFPENKCIDFVRAVCLWGRDPRRGGKVIKRNSGKAISMALKSAYKATKQGRFCDSLAEITALEGLAVSFGSKHLKFLSPDHHVVLDSIISERLGYRRDLNGYSEWRSACYEFLTLVRQAGVSYPGIGNNGWRVADIELAIYSKIRSE